MTDQDRTVEPTTPTYTQRDDAPPGLGTAWADLAAAFTRAAEAMRPVMQAVVDQMATTWRNIVAMFRPVMERDGDTSQRFICRTHGEFLVYRAAHHQLRCPEHAVCGTWVHGDRLDPRPEDTPFGGDPW